MLKTVKILSLVIVILLFFAISSSYAENDEIYSNLHSLFYKANSYYEDGNFEKAVQTYQHILNTGYVSGELYYNLANAYYRMGEKGKAYLNYLRARYFIPRDPDLRSNLEYLKKELQLSDAGKGWLIRFTNWLTDYLTLRELALLTSVFYTLIVILIMLWLFIPKLRQYLKIPVFIVLLCFILFSVGTGLSAYWRYFTNPAIVVVKETVARFEPSLMGEVHYTLTEGDSVEVETIRNGWFLIRRYDGKKGWVQDKEVDSLWLKFQK
ncbi:hypothetical protein BBF96_07480 [Anoxybacter fermentans]|uniref:SH3b domain-containing protein n=1 Tax=Anoxybacter fermentans TaxID=1323375 RepID=A0A3S9SY58_9FIRM|nr:SH3 domain-containing protein [Anoxybacter fermentans]AZR73239.1 hypothetical protein BBF96_07480 [Anoxybacter fermentans]